MAVSLNLLNAAAADVENSATRRPGLAGVCVFLLAVTAAAALYQYYLLYSLYEKKNAAYSELDSVNAGLSAMNGRLDSAETRLEEVGEVLDFMLGDVRAGEILSVLTVCAAEDAVVERLELTSDSMTLFGNAKNERGIAELYRALLSSNIFSSVSKPRVVPESGSGLSFAFQCKTAGIPGAGSADD